MTKKRFTFMQDTLVKADVFDGDEFVCCTLSVWVEQLVDKLNSLNEENEQLKENCKNYEWYKQYKAILNENEQLKQTNQRLNDELQVCMGKLALKR